MVKEIKGEKGEGDQEKTQSRLGHFQCLYLTSVINQTNGEFEFSALLPLSPVIAASLNPEEAHCALRAQAHSF